MQFTSPMMPTPLLLSVAVGTRQGGSAWRVDAVIEVWCPWRRVAVLNERRIRCLGPCAPQEERHVCRCERVTGHTHHLVPAREPLKLVRLEVPWRPMTGAADLIEHDIEHRLVEAVVVPVASVRHYATALATPLENFSSQTLTAGG